MPALIRLPAEICNCHAQGICGTVLHLRRHYYITYPFTMQTYRQLMRDPYVVVVQVQ